MHITQGFVALVEIMGFGALWCHCCPKGPLLITTAVVFSLGSGLVEEQGRWVVRDGWWAALDREARFRTWPSQTHLRREQCLPCTALFFWWCEQIHLPSFYSFESQSHMQLIEGDWFCSVHPLLLFPRRASNMKPHVTVSSRG